MERRKLRTAVAAFFVATGVLGTGTAYAEPNASQVCKLAGDAGTTHGACVSLAQAGNPTALISDLCRIPGVAESVGAANHGQCINVIRASL